MISDYLDHPQRVRSQLRRYRIVAADEGWRIARTLQKQADMLRG